MAVSQGHPPRTEAVQHLLTLALLNEGLSLLTFAVYQEAMEVEGDALSKAGQAQGAFRQEPTQE